MTVALVLSTLLNLALLILYARAHDQSREDAAAALLTVIALTSDTTSAFKELAMGRAPNPEPAAEQQVDERITDDDLAAYDLGDPMAHITAYDDPASPPTWALEAMGLTHPRAGDLLPDMGREVSDEELDVYDYGHLADIYAREGEEGVLAATGFGEFEPATPLDNGGAR